MFLDEYEILDIRDQFVFGTWTQCVFDAMKYSLQWVSFFCQHSATKLQSKYINLEVSNILQMYSSTKMLYVQFYFSKLQ